jgi:very-short-patch-repair endonuclease
MDQRILELAETQHGLVARAQAQKMGITKAAWHHAIASGEWHPATARVIRRTGSPRTDEQRILAATLHIGLDAVVTSSTTLALFGVPGWNPHPVHALVPRRAVRRERVAIVHTTTSIDDGDLAVVAGIPTVTPIRALFEVAGTVHPRKLERALDNAWARRLVSYALLHRTLNELAARGRNGIRVLRELAAARPPEYRPPESNNEAHLNDVLEAAGLPRLRRQVNAGDDERWIGRMDMADPSLPLIVEVHSELYHGSNLDRQRDKAKRKSMEEAGWTFVEAWETELWRTPHVVVARVADARQRLLRAA